MIDVQVLKKSATNQATYIKGTKLFENYAISSLQCIQQEGKTYHLQGSVNDEPHIHTATLTWEGNTLKTYRCTCIESKGYPGLCKHGIALALQSRVEDVIVTKPFEETSTHQDPLLEQLMSQYQQLRYKIEETEEPEGVEGTLQLYTTIMDVQNEQVVARLMMRYKMPERITSMSKLAQSIRNKTRMVVGKEQAIPLSIEVFQEQSQYLVHLLLEEGELTDDAYWKMSANTWQKYFQYHLKESQGNWKKENPPIRFVVKKEKENYILWLQEEETLYPLYEGRYFRHYQEEISLKETIYQVDATFYTKVMPLYRMLKRQPKAMLKMDEPYLVQILPMLQEVLGDKLDIHIKDEQLDQLLPPPLEAKIYLDAPRPNTVTAKVTFTYEAVTYNPLSQLTEEEWEAGTQPTDEQDMHSTDAQADTKYISPTAHQQSQARELLRDTHKESYIQQLLQCYGFEPKGRTYTLKGEDEIYDFMTEGVKKIEPLVTFYISDTLRHVKVKRVKNISVGISIEGDWIDIDLDCLGIPREELATLLTAYRAKKRYYRMKNGDFINLSDEGMIQLENLVEGLHLTDKDLSQDELVLPRYRALYLDKLLKEEENILTHKDETFKTLIHDFGMAQDRQVAVPTTIKAELRPYQKSGFHWMEVLTHYGFGGILADDMGLGKTLQVIAVLEAHRVRQERAYLQSVQQSKQNTQQVEAPSLIVAPTSLVLNWIQEFEKFTYCTRATAVVGSAEQREKILKKPQPGQILVTSYDLLKRDEAHYKDITFEYCIIDEAQYIKNAATQNAKAVKSIQSRHKLALTGTPIENSLTELWSIFDFIMPGYLYSESQFKKEFESPILKHQDEKVLARLKKLISPFILRRLKKDVLEELPDKIETTLYNTMGELQQKAYTAHAIQAKQELMAQIEEEGIEKSHIKMLACLTRLRQICCDPNLCVEAYTGESSKLNTCMELLTNTVESGHKVLLFSQFTSMLDIIGEQLDKKGIKHTTIRGNVNAKERMRRVQAFNEGETQVFLISLKAGGVGLNLTRADVVIHYDPWWNISAQNQATDRAYRLGQKNNVQVFKLITKGTVEEKIKALQDKKKDLTEGVLSTEHTLINQLTQAELLELFT